MKDQKNPLITIITPTFMQGQFIEDTIRSVYSQTYQNIEHIVIDSCSTDGTDKIVERYLGTYNLKYIREKDNGQAHAINKGFDLASGDIVCWLNSDDIYFNDSVLETVVKLFASMPTVDVVTGGGYYVDEELNLVTPYRIDTPEYLTHDYMKIFDSILQPSTFWLKNDLRLDQKMHYAFDWKYFLEFYEQRKSILYVPDYFSCYRLQSNSKTVMDSSKRKLEIISLLKVSGAKKKVVLWNYFVYWCYVLSERSNIDLFRKAALRLNRFISSRTNKKIYSS